MTRPIIMFDMDGTLLDLAFDDLIWNHRLPERHALAHHCSLQQSQATLFEFYQQHKHTISWYSSRYWTEKVGVDTLALQKEFQAHIKPRRGCFELLKMLKEQGYRCWLVTNADCAGLALKLENVDLQPYFDVMISSEQIGYSKEYVEFWQILQSMHPFDPAEVVLIDDTAAVLTGAQRFGIQHLVTITQPSTQKAQRQSHELDYPAIDHLTEFLPLLAQFNLKDLDAKTA